MIEVNIFIDEDDFYEGIPAHEHIMRWLMHHNIAGATIFHGKMGYGRKMHLHHADTFASTDETPIMIVFIDEKSNVMQVLPHIKEVVKEGLVICKEVEKY